MSSGTLKPLIYLLIPDVSSLCVALEGSLSLSYSSLDNDSSADVPPTHSWLSLQAEAMWIVREVDAIQSGRPEWKDDKTESQRDAPVPSPRREVVDVAALSTTGPATPS